MLRKNLPEFEHDFRKARRQFERIVADTGFQTSLSNRNIRRSKHPMLLGIIRVLCGNDNAHKHGKDTSPEVSPKFEYPEIEKLAFFQSTKKTYSLLFYAHHPFLS